MSVPLTFPTSTRAEFTCICRTPTLISGTRLCAAGACAAGTVQIIDQVCQDLAGGGTLPPGLGTTAGGGNPLSSIGTGAASPAPAPVQTGNPAAAPPAVQSPGGTQNGQQGTGAGDSGGAPTVLSGSAATWKRRSKALGVVAVCVGLMYTS
ncbi:hypothetical protein EXIGLDRAFT_51468 [Exidia glandulosa HHB12029]|uniref:Uncharacterized protein n=1 Tax=Exidia glandulosa HHB12029 TaxID=1314781 RepID=A0A165IEU4_EXIGL|nr:hypothetical protein EXIGLDRAFT_51468 [Exidia glandulosa HHB12029]